MVWLPVRVFLRHGPPSRVPLFSRPVVRALTAIFLLAVAGWLLAGFDGGLANSREVATEAAVTGWPGPADKFLYWPYYFFVWLVNLGLGDWLTSARLLSAFWGWLAVVSLMVILRRWSNSSLAIAGGVLLASNSWFLNLAKVGSPEVLLVAVPLVSGAVLVRFWGRWHRVRARTSLIAIFLIGWFLPVWPWFLLALLLWRLTQPVSSWRGRFGLAAAMVTLAAGSLWALTQNLGLIHDWSGLPSPLPDPGRWLTQLIEVPQALVWRTPPRPGYWLAGLPLVDILGVVLLVFGVSTLWRSARGRLRWLSLGALGAWWLLVSLGGGTTSPGFLLGVGVVLAVAGIGLVELWVIWQRVFPTNPIAHLVGFSVLLGLVGLSAFYQSYKYWVVQPRYQPGDPLANQIVMDRSSPDTGFFGD